MKLQPLTHFNRERRERVPGRMFEGVSMAPAGPPIAMKITPPTPHHLQPRAAENGFRRVAFYRAGRRHDFQRSGDHRFREGLIVQSGSLGPDDMREDSFWKQTAPADAKS